MGGSDRFAALWDGVSNMQEERREKAAQTRRMFLMFLSLISSASLNLVGLKLYAS
jgi:hypothetical protein